ncbi:helix-turn-helix domain-containing protein [Methylorubrum sp. Q1]|uniref:helix-turn-helix domain-containing protein n=1 Tax=Methylorubrum sp. Q1 TaxID=2562453 RepID=UPI00187D55AB|nr:helix-turn-helix domain-containing protein [Methylorubrum sp. Q1]
MSIEAISWVIKQDIPDGVAKLVAMVLADYADRHTGEAHPKIKQLAQACSQSERSVQRKLRVLQDLDVITIQNGHCPKSGRQRANSYILHLPDVDVPGRNERSVRGDQNGAGSGKPSLRGDFGTPQISAEGCPSVTGEGDNVVTGEGDSPVTPIENPSDSTVRKESPHPPGGGAGVVQKQFRGNPPSASAERILQAGRSPPGRLTGPAAEQFARLWAAFPEGGRLDADRSMAERIFAALPPADRDLAVSAAGTYAAHLAKHPGRSAKALHTWLRTRRFENARPSAPPAAAIAATRVFVEEGTPAWNAWMAFRRARGEGRCATTSKAGYVNSGWYFPSEWPVAADGVRAA